MNFQMKRKNVAYQIQIKSTSCMCMIEFMNSLLIANNLEIFSSRQTNFEFNYQAMQSLCIFIMPFKMLIVLIWILENVEDLSDMII